MNEEAYKILFLAPEDERKFLVFSYDLFLVFSNGHMHTVHHQIAPYQLCKNGNVWIGLCSIVTSSSKNSGHPKICNIRTGDQYHFVHDTFIRGKSITFTDKELAIIRWMVKGLSSEEISARINKSTSTLKRIKWVIFSKMGVHSAAEAVHWAHLRGII